MERYTEPSAQGIYHLAPAQVQLQDGRITGPAVERLAAFENLYENLLRQQEEISQKLEVLRGQGKTNSYQFRELMGKKLMNSHTLSLIALYVE